MEWTDCAKWLFYLFQKKKKKADAIYENKFWSLLKGIKYFTDVGCG